MNRIILKFMRKLHRLIFGTATNWLDESAADLYDQEANDFIRSSIENAKNGLMICKFGTIELRAICCFNTLQKGPSVKDYFEAINEKQSLFADEAMLALCNNAGFFPNDESLGIKYTELVMQDIKEIDILASYIKQEKQLAGMLDHCKKVNLNGYYAPFLWGDPWTKALAGKKVLVVHPFVESIKSQYERRELLFENPDVLPKFGELILVKAVQSIAGNGEDTGYENWFEALQTMKEEIDKHDYDIALIGCGAYGFDLAAHVKRRGKVAVHLAGWTQMLFGIYGNRWIQDQPEFSRFINEYWIRPSEMEKPTGVENVENACYW